MKNKDIFILTIVMIVIFGFFIPFVNKDKERHAEMPELDQQYVKAYSGGIAISSREELNLSEADAKTLINYINYSGRDWTKTESITYSEEKLNKLYFVYINDKQFFMFPREAEENGTIDIILSSTGTEDQTVMVKTTVNSSVAARMLELLRGYSK